MVQSAQTNHLTKAAERIVRTAAALFAEHGYHGVTTRQIASAVGLNVATVHYHVGTKQELYHKVYTYLDAEDQAFMALLLGPVQKQIAEAAIPLPTLISELVDKTVSFLATSPFRIRFYIRYWLDAEQPSLGHKGGAFAHTTAHALYVNIGDILQTLKEQKAVRLDVDTELLLQGVLGLIYTYILTGTFDWRMLHGDPWNPENLHVFKSSLCKYVCQMLGLWDAPVG